MLDTNRVWGQAVMETLGYEPLCVATARNRIERGERIADWAYWFGLGISLPLLLEKHAARPLGNSLRQAFGLVLHQGRKATETSLLHIPLQWVDAAKTSTQHIPKESLSRMAQQLQLPSSQLEGLMKNPSFKAMLARRKTQLMAIDMGTLALKGHVFFVAKNFLSNHFSGKSGFSGEFNYTEESFRKDSSKEFQAHVKRRWMTGAGIGIALSTGFPALVYAVNQAKQGHLTGLQSILHRLKPLTKWVEYTEGTFMPRMVVFLTDLANYTLPMLLASRDKHELRESALRALAFDGFYFLGSGAVSASVGNMLQKRLNSSISILEHHPNMPKWLSTQPKSLASVYREVSESLNTQDRNIISKHPAYQAARKAMWAGMIASGIALGGAVPLLNNWLTYQCVKKQTKPSDPHPPRQAETDTPLMSTSKQQEHQTILETTTSSKPTPSNHLPLIGLAPVLFGNTSTTQYTMPSTASLNPFTNIALTNATLPSTPRITQAPLI
ncbi:MAG: hypothetical protein ACKO37_08895 [Vampirovibrionales bacterium]